jgi:hypothetical protein
VVSAVPALGALTFCQAGQPLTRCLACLADNGWKFFGGFDELPSRSLSNARQYSIILRLLLLPKAHAAAYLPSHWLFIEVTCDTLMLQKYWTPLHLASAHGHEAVAVMLIRHGARVDVITTVSMVIAVLK